MASIQEAWLVLESMPYCDDIDIVPFSTKDEAALYVKNSVESYDTGWDKEGDGEAYERNVEIRHEDDYSYAAITFYENDAAVYADTVEWRVVRKTLSELIPDKKEEDMKKEAVLTVGEFRKVLAGYPAAVNAVKGRPDDEKILCGDIMVNTECIAGVMFDRRWLKGTVEGMGYKGTDEEIEAILSSCDFDDIVVDAATDAVWNAVGAACEEVLAEDD